MGRYGADLTFLRPFFTSRLESQTVCLATQLTLRTRRGGRYGVTAADLVAEEPELYNASTCGHCAFRFVICAPILSFWLCSRGTSPPGSVRAQPPRFILASVRAGH